MLKIIDLGVGNIGSVIKAIKHIGVKHQVINQSEDLVDAEKILLPGVGSFSAASARLMESGFHAALQQQVLYDKVPVLGICVGMQLLGRFGNEGGRNPGLGFIDAEVNKLNNFNGELSIPHVGWNDIKTNGLKIFDGIDDGSCFYFVHSYAMRIGEAIDIATTDYGEDIVAYVNKGNIHGAQFHPEKSQDSGLMFLRNFVELC